MASSFQDEITRLGVEGHGVADRFTRTLRGILLWVHSFDIPDELCRGMLDVVATPPPSSPGTASAV